MTIHRVSLLLALLLALASPALAGPVRCTTYEEKTFGRWQTVCDDGTRAVSIWSPSLQRWESLVTPPPGQPTRICTPATTGRPAGGRGLEVHCR